MEFEGSRPIAPRLLLTSRVGWFVLEHPVFIPAGCRFWSESAALVVEPPAGERRKYPGSVVR
ncbi:hypothetical protein [Streptacidiphilus sp. MAP5-3]|uniref:hypothetical protein n=1 Tax=unclassified Streptacidiphilus TaxID=2643834 RepID=UPI003517A083